MSVGLEDHFPNLGPAFAADEILTSDRPVRRFSSGWEACAVSIPATEFTGDFFTTTELDGVAWFALGDFSGHGLEASIFMMMVQEELERVIAKCHGEDLVEIIATLDKTIREELPVNRFASLVVGRADSDGTITLINAGHCHPLVLRADGTVETVGPNGPVIGIVPMPGWCSTTLSFDHGDRLLLYTDGLLEARNELDEEFGLERIGEVASRSRGATIDALLSAAERFSEGRQEDDLTVFVLART